MTEEIRVMTAVLKQLESVFGQLESQQVEAINGLGEQHRVVHEVRLACLQLDNTMRMVSAQIDAAKKQ